MAKRSNSSKSSRPDQLARAAAKARDIERKARDRARKLEDKIKEREKRQRQKEREKQARAIKNTVKRVFRSAVAKLKKSGLVKPSIDARKVQPTQRSLREKVKKYDKVIEGKEKAFKVSDKKARQALKEQGYSVEGDRVVLAQTLAYRKGKVRAAKPSGKRSSEVTSIRLGRNFERQIRDAFANLKGDEYIGFNVGGHNSLSIYQVADAMLNDLAKYNLEKREIGYIRVFRVEDAPRYIEQRRADKLAVDRAREIRSNQRRRERKAKAKSGMRVSRGH